jgi:hypothetical protein
MPRDGGDHNDLIHIGDLAKKLFPDLRPPKLKKPKPQKPPSRTLMRQVDAALAIRESAAIDDDLAFQHTYFCQTALPYRKCPERTWFRKNGRVFLRIEAGGSVNPETEQWVDFPLPFGPAARLILIHLDTEAIRSQSPDVELEDSMTAFVKRLQGGRSPNGSELRLFKQQAAALATAVFRMGETTGPNVDVPRTTQGQGPIVDGLELWYPKDARQRILWPSYVHLSPNYFASLQAHAVPLDYRAVAALAHNALALDIYKWLAQRLCRIDPKHPQFIAWTRMQDQFGLGYSKIRFFRRDFIKTVAKVLEQYQAAKPNVKWDGRGVTLHLTRPPIQRKAIA